MANKKLGKNRFSAGSALILTVVLTTLLAIVGVVFVMMARVDKISTSAISENRELNFAVEAVIAKISQELALDIPRGASCCPGQEYYDYPDPCNAWLASLEPDVERDPSDPTKDIYYWRQISDVTGYINQNWGVAAQRNVPVVPLNLSTTKYVREYPEIRLDLHPVTGELVLVEQSADADGDGIADSKWIQLDGGATSAGVPNYITTSKGKPIYAAIRIVDNGAMLNVNTAYKFDPYDPNVQAAYIDGSRLAQIHLLNFAKGSDDPNDLHRFRCDGDEPGLLIFNDECAIRIENPDRTNINYLPYDVSDELELRNRFVLDAQYSTVRVEAALPITLAYPQGKTFGNRFAPIDSSIAFTAWKRILNPFDPNDSYNFRHLLTTYNIDRIIDPNCRKMININEEVLVVNKQVHVRMLYDSLRRGIDLKILGPLRWQIEARLAQLAVNIIDFADSDTIVTTLPDPCGIPHYGFEAQPFITEIGMKTKPGSIYCAVELYNPFDKAINLVGDFEIELTYSEEPNSTGTVLTVPFASGDRIDANGYFVIANVLREFNIYPPSQRMQDPRLTFFGNWQPPGGRKPPVVPGPGRKPPVIRSRPGGNGNLFLKRRVVDTVGTEKWLYVDQQIVDPNWVPRNDERYFGRDVRRWHIIYQTLEPALSTLGISNNIAPTLFVNRDHNFSFYLPNPTIRPPYRTMTGENRTKLLTVGDITRILTIGHGTTPDSTIGQQLWDIGQLWETDKNKEEKVRLNLRNPLYRNIFQYLTVFDPSTDDIDNDNDGLKDANDIIGPEWKIPGRININTAPWYVIAQLPWMTEPIAQAIVAYRDKLRLPVDYRSPSLTIEPDPNSRQFATGISDLREDPGFASIGELNFVVAAGTIDGSNAYRIQRYEPDGNDLGSEFIGHPGFPDLTTDGPDLGDGVVDDFEERDIIFSRISNLVTVRSDVFTAYILVRIGTDGPQKRVIAILDRSDVYSPNGKVRLVALHYVPDPR